MKIFRFDGLTGQIGNENLEAMLIKWYFASEFVLKAKKVLATIGKRVRNSSKIALEIKMWSLILL